MSKRVKDFRPATRNANRHTARGLSELEKSLRRDGWIGAMTTAADGEMIAGSARIEKAADVFGVEAEPIVIESDGTRPIVVVRTDIPNAEDARAQRLGLADNRVAALDLSFDVEVIASYSTDILVDLWTPAELSELGDRWADEQDALLAVPKDAKPNPRKLPIDAIFTGGFTAGCCLAVASGFQYGIQSSDKACPRAAPNNNHKTCFVDNDYFKYDHAAHLRFVSEQKPKYCTVRDIMAREQCKAAGIEYYPFEQIMEWAEELSQYAQNVIVIPKYECLDKIPEKFVLGYSVPTSHGGTPLPVEAFKGRRVHLLGGSWPDQMAHMTQLGDDIVSFDNNHIARLADFGSFIDMEGKATDLYKSGYGYVANPKYVALALSLGAIAAKVNELYAGSASPAEN